MLTYEKFIAYQKSIQFIKQIPKLQYNIPSGNTHLCEQLKRASSSIPLNIAEGTGKNGKDRKRFYKIARGSALECGAIIDVMYSLEMINEKRQIALKNEIQEIVSILSTVIKK